MDDELRGIQWLATVTGSPSEARRCNKADINDALCVRTSYVNQEHDFFFVLHNSLAEKEEVIGLQLALDARVPVLKLKFDGISIDLLYARICLLVVPQDVDVSDVLVFYNVDEPTV
ncbi:hypothetical protein QUC31_019434 [Theobroma cacao]